MRNAVSSDYMNLPRDHGQAKSPMAMTDARYITDS